MSTTLLETCRGL